MTLAEAILAAQQPQQAVPVPLASMPMGVPQPVGDVIPFPKKPGIAPISPGSDPAWVPGTPEYIQRMDELLERMKGMYRGGTTPKSDA